MKSTLVMSRITSNKKIRYFNFFLDTILFINQHCLKQRRKFWKFSTQHPQKNRLQTNILDVRKLFESKFPETRPRRGSDLKRETRPRRGSDLIRENPSKENASQSSPKIDTIKFIIPEISYNMTFSKDTLF